MQKYFQAVKLKTVKFCIYGLVSLFLLAAVSKAQGKESNLDLADSIYVSVLDSLFSGVVEPALKLYDPHSGKAAFLRSGWIHYWASADANKGQDSVALLCVIDRFGITIDYYEENGRLLGFNRKIKRRFTFFLQGWLSNTVTGKVVRSFSVIKRKNDDLDADRLAEIEKSPFLFTKGTMKTKSVWMHYLQPGVVIAAVSTIVYLFFSVRT